ncbi:MAG TPA: hypothetical protein VMG31_06840 [Verrucomicrobiae bacterium]|nr:hypothetical protein [Verrucomicrobiae bacterium]
MSVFVLGLVLAWPVTPALAQGCAMCYATAKATPREGQRALNRAILVMLVPPLGIMMFGANFVFRYARRHDRENGTD